MTLREAIFFIERKIQMDISKIDSHALYFPQYISSTMFDFNDGLGTLKIFFVQNTLQAC